MKVNIFDFPVGSVRLTGDTSMAAQLGQLATQGDKIYRLVKANGAIASPAGKIMTSTYSSDGKAWAVNVPTTVQLPCDGVIPADYGTTTIATGSYFWMQVSGIVSVLAGGTTMVYGSTTLSLVSGNTSGQAAVYTAGTDAVTVFNSAIGSLLNTAVVTAAGDTVKMMIVGMV
jgi:hypothetical protein